MNCLAYSSQQKSIGSTVVAPPPPPTVMPCDCPITPVSTAVEPFRTSAPVTGGRVTGGGAAFSAFSGTAGFFSGTVFAGTFMTSGFAGGVGFGGSGRFGGGAAFSISRAPIDVVPVVFSPMPAPRLIVISTGGFAWNHERGKKKYTPSTAT